MTQDTKVGYFVAMVRDRVCDCGFLDDCPQTSDTLVYTLEELVDVINGFPHMRVVRISKASGR